MSEKEEKLEKKGPFGIISVEDWLDEKRKLDGAEGLWRIHDKLYDFTIWSRTHPGGKFFLDVSRGTDITEAFETHHFSDKAESLLQNFYKRDAATPRNVSTTFRENGFFKVFKRKVSQMQSRLPDESFLAVALLSDSLAAAVFITGLFGVKSGIPWTIVSGIFLGLLSACSHSFFHTKDNWRIHYFNLSLMSSREWRIRHVLSHHQYRNTILDLEVPVWQPIPENNKKLSRSIRLILNVFLFFVLAHIQFFKRCLDVFLSKKLKFHPEELVAFSLPLFLYLFSGMQQWTTFVSWNLIILIGSFVFCCISSNTSETQKNSESILRVEQDFGVAQLTNFRGHPKENQSLFSFLNSFRGNVLHYLNPAIKWESLHEFVPIFEKTINEFGISYEESKGVLAGLQNGMPQGHVFFS